MEFSLSMVKGDCRRPRTSPRPRGSGAAAGVGELGQPPLGVGGADDPGAVRGGGHCGKGGNEGCCGSVLVIVSTITFGSRSPASAKSAGSCRRERPLAALRAQQSAMATVRIGSAPRMACSPVGVDDNDPSTGSDDADDGWTGTELKAAMRSPRG
jgi:hypothetical protein